MCFASIHTVGGLGGGLGGAELVLEEDGETGSVSQENEATGVGDLAGLSLSSIVVVGDVLASSARDGGGRRLIRHASLFQNWST